MAYFDERQCPFRLDDQAGFVKVRIFFHIPEASCSLMPSFFMEKPKSCQQRSAKANPLSMDQATELVRVAGASSRAGAASQGSPHHNQRPVKRFFG